MKKIVFTLITMVTMITSAKAMDFGRAQEEALYLSDKMAYELNLDDDQYDAVYEINLDYLTGLSVGNDIFGIHWDHRNQDLKYVLTGPQYRIFLGREYFYRPVYWNSGFVFRIYTHYTDRHHFYHARPRHYASYHGAHSWHRNGNRSYYHGHRFGGGHAPARIEHRAPAHHAPAHRAPAPRHEHHAPAHHCEPHHSKHHR